MHKVRSLSILNVHYRFARIYRRETEGTLTEGVGLECERLLSVHGRGWSGQARGGGGAGGSASDDVDDDEGEAAGGAGAARANEREYSRRATSAALAGGYRARYTPARP